MAYLICYVLHCLVSYGKDKTGRDTIKTANTMEESWLGKTLEVISAA